jgi:hypothetical protein
MNDYVGRNQRNLREGLVLWGIDAGHHLRSPTGTIELRMPFFYQSGEQIKLRDRVRLHGEPGEIESIHDPVDDPHDWYVETYGGGVMVAESRVFGRLFINAPVTQYDHLEFMSRVS